MVAALLCLVTFLCAAAGDYVETRYVQAATERQAHRAARLSVGMYVVGFAGWVVTVKISLWYALPEVVGLYLGTWYAARRRVP